VSKIATLTLDPAPEECSECLLVRFAKEGTALNREYACYCGAKAGVAIIEKPFDSERPKWCPLEIVEKPIMRCPIHDKIPHEHTIKTNAYDRVWKCTCEPEKAGGGGG